MANPAEQLRMFKSLYPQLPYIQTLTLDDVDRTMNGQAVDWNAVTPADFLTGDIFAASTVTAGTAHTAGLLQGSGNPIPPCAMAVGFVLFDVVSLSVGAWGLRSAVRPATIQAMAGAAAPAITKIERIIAEVGAHDASATDIAYGVFRILVALYDGGLVGPVFHAFTNSLTWWNMILYGVTGIATIIATLATDGLALVAEVVIVLATAGFLVSDLVNAVRICTLTPTTPPPTPTPKPGEPYKPSVAIRTYSGNFLTVIKNGGLGGGNSETAIQTNKKTVGPWEKFTLVPLDVSSKTFALKTATGNYLTATDGGGLGGPEDAMHPVQTDRTAVGGWESLVLIQQPDGTYSILTTSGYYLTAINGGGTSGPDNDSSILHTDATGIGRYETFTFDSL